MADPRFEKRLNTVEKKVVSIETKIDMFIGEMRQQNEMRANEIREIRTSIDNMGKHVRNLTVAGRHGHDDACRYCHCDFDYLKIIFGSDLND